MLVYSIVLCLFATVPKKLCLLQHISVPFSRCLARLGTFRTVPPPRAEQVHLLELAVGTASSRRNVVLSRQRWPVSGSSFVCFAPSCPSLPILPQLPDIILPGKP